MDQLITGVDSIILGFVQGSFGSLSGTIHMLWQLMFIVFIAFYGYKVMANGQFSAPDLVVQCLKVIIVLIMATSWDAFFTFAYRTATDLPSDIAGQLITAASHSLGAESQADSALTANTALSQYYMRAMDVSERLLEGAGMDHPWYFLYVGIIWLSVTCFTGYAAMLILLAKISVAILLAIGPIFILALIFFNTKPLFDGWLKNLVSFALFPVFIYALLALLLAIGEAPLRFLESNTNPYDSFMTGVGPFSLVMFISILLLTQITTIAGTITGGLSISTGALHKSPRATVASIKATGAGLKGYAWATEKSIEGVQYTARKINEGRKKLGAILKKRGEAI